MFRISPSINLKFLCDSKSAIFAFLPVSKLSKQVTLLFLSNKAWHKLDPIKPAPPVTKTLLFVKFIFINTFNF